MSYDNSTYTLPLDQAETINYFCNIGDYCSRGMWGSIEIKDPNVLPSQSLNSNPNPDNPSETSNGLSQSPTSSNDSPQSLTSKPPNDIVKNIIIILSVLAGMRVMGGAGYLMFKFGCCNNYFNNWFSKSDNKSDEQNNKNNNNTNNWNYHNNYVSNYS